MMIRKKMTSIAIKMKLSPFLSELTSAIHRHAPQAHQIDFIGRGSMHGSGDQMTNSR